MHLKHGQRGSRGQKLAHEFGFAGYCHQHRPVQQAGLDAIFRCASGHRESQRLLHLVDHDAAQFRIRLDHQPARGWREHEPAAQPLSQQRLRRAYLARLSHESAYQLIDGKLGGQLR